jgi:hypothetical protein
VGVMRAIPFDGRPFSGTPGEAPLKALRKWARGGQPGNSGSQRRTLDPW